MSKLLILGGCNLTSDHLLHTLRIGSKYESIKKIFTHFSEANYEKALKVVQGNVINEEYDILLQFDNLYFSDNFSHFYPESFNKKLDKFKDYDGNSAIPEVKVASNKSFILVRNVLKVFVYPINLCIIPLCGYLKFKKLKRVLVQKKSIGKVMILTPFWTSSVLDNTFRRIGRHIVKALFDDNENNFLIFDTFRKTQTAQHLKTDALHMDKDSYERLERELLLFLNDPSIAAK